MKPEPLIKESSKPARDLGFGVQLGAQLVPLHDLWLQVKYPANAQEAAVLKGVLPRLKGLRLTKARFVLGAWQVVESLRRVSASNL